MGAELGVEGVAEGTQLGVQRVAEGPEFGVKGVAEGVTLGVEGQNFHLNFTTHCVVCNYLAQTVCNFNH